MRTPEQVREILRALAQAYPAECSLQYQKDYELLFAVRLAAQCTDERVNQITPALFARFPTLEAFAAAEPEDIEPYVRSCGFFRAKARDIALCARKLVTEYGGRVPDTMEALTSLPGVGRKTANLILGDVYHKPAVVVDTHCIRLSNRMGLVDGLKDPVKIETALRKIELLYNRAAARRKEQYSLLDMPLGRRASLYIATHSTAELTAASVAEAVSSDADETALNHALLIATGLNFSQYVNRVRLILAMSYFLYDSLPFDYVSSISGFHMSITFFRRFKALTGMTPQGYLNDMLSDGKNGRVYRGMIMSETLISAISYLYENMS